MKHPEVLLLPVMMLADYYLTVLGAVLRDKGYSRHFKTEHYELNPIWQKHVAQKKWFNPRHLALTILFSGSLVYLMELGTVPRDTDEGMLGFILVVYGMILGSHLSNLLTFSHVIWKPEAVSGELTMTHQFALSLSLYRTLVVLVPIALVAALSSSNYARGGVVGIAFLMLAQLVWLLRAKWRGRRP